MSERRIDSHYCLFTAIIALGFIAMLSWTAIAAIPIPVVSAEEGSDDGQVTFTYDDLKYEIYDENFQTVAVVGLKSTECPAELDIPSTVVYNNETYSVIFIGASAFKGCGGLLSVTIPYNVECIYESAFEGCTGLRQVTFDGNHLSAIEKNAFKDCAMLTLTPDLMTGQYSLPDEIREIGEYAFYGCTSLTI